MKNEKRSAAIWFLALTVFAVTLLALAFPAVCAESEKPPETTAAQGPPEVYAAGPDSYGYTAQAVPFTFEDIGGTGAFLMTGWDDHFEQIAPGSLAGFTFPFYGVVYNSMFVSSNGLITFGSGSDSWSNQNLATEPTQSAIAVLWDDLDSRNAGAGIYYQLKGSGDAQRLIIQWNNVKFYQYSDAQHIPMTFQAVLYKNGNIQYNFFDIVGYNPYSSSQSDGASATIGIKAAGNQGGNKLLLSYNAGPNLWVGTGKSTLISAPPIAQTIITKTQDNPIEQSSIGNVLAANMLLFTGIIVIIAFWRRKLD